MVDGMCSKGDEWRITTTMSTTMATAKKPWPVMTTTMPTTTVQRTRPPPGTTITITTPTTTTMTSTRPAPSTWCRSSRVRPMRGIRARAS